jgi:hypothetical protein
VRRLSWKGGQSGAAPREPFAAVFKGSGGEAGVSGGSENTTVYSGVVMCNCASVEPPQGNGDPVAQRKEIRSLFFRKKKVKRKC